MQWGTQGDLSILNLFPGLIRHLYYEILIYRDLVYFSQQFSIYGCYSYPGDIGKIAWDNLTDAASFFEQNYFLSGGLFYEGAKAKKFYRSMISDASAAIQWAFLTRVRADILALLLAQVGGNSLRIRISFQKRRQSVGENVIF